METKYLIIGAGPTGLGAAHRLKELGEESFTVLERDGWAGGLASSFEDDNGFTWDIGGHVVFSHYEYFDNLMDSLMGDEQLEHVRESWVRSNDTWVPYPFQNNIRYLPREVVWECVRGLLPDARPTETPENFRQWIESIFGAGIAKHFMFPYNYKVWATPPELMQFSWIGERVSVVDLKMVLKNILLEQDDVAWGPNATFKFPLKGGTGEIFRRMAKGVEDHIQYNQPVVYVDAYNKVVRTAEGLEIKYEKLLNTAPLDIFVKEWLTIADDHVINAASQLTHNSVHVTGIGVDANPEDFNERCWMYFPDQDCPSYRITNFHHYSPNNVAKPGKQLAFMCETSFSEHKREKVDTLVDQTIQGLINTELVDTERAANVRTRWEIAVDYGYPVPCLARDGALATIQPELEAMDIYSRGRFGGWKYEVSNMDHSVMQGVEWAGFMVKGEPETTYSWK